MKLNELIELNGKEYKVELNRESIIRIEQYSNISKLTNKLQEETLKDKSNIDISDDEDPFAETIDENKINELAKEKEEALKKLYSRAFWIWLYPQEKLSLKEVEEILEPYYSDDEKGDADYLANKYAEFMEKSVEIRQQYIEEQKNLKALAK